MNISLYWEDDTENPDLHADFLKDVKEKARKVVQYTFETHNCPCDGEVAIYIVDEEEIQKVNCKARGIDRVTDVLSFPNLPFEKEGDFSFLSDAYTADYYDPESRLLLLGEMMICIEKVYEQAHNYGHSRQREFCFLVAHSALHLLGYDHEEQEERLRMEEKQEEILTALGYTRDM